MRSMIEIKKELSALLHTLIISSNKTVTDDLHHVLTSTGKRSYLNAPLRPRHCGCAGATWYLTKTGSDLSHAAGDGY